MARRGKTQRRRRQRGGVNPLKALLATTALALSSTPGQAVSLREAYEWLSKKHTPEEIQAVASKFVESAQTIAPPSLAGIAVDKLQAMFADVQEHPLPVPNTQIPSLQIRDGGKYEYKGNVFEVMGWERLDKSIRVTPYEGESIFIPDTATVKVLEPPIDVVDDPYHIDINGPWVGEGRAGKRRTRRHRRRQRKTLRRKK